MAEKNFTSAPGPTELRERGLGGVGLTQTGAEIAAAKAAATKEKEQEQKAKRDKKRKEQEAERLKLAQQRLDQLRASDKDLRSRRQKLIDAIAEGTTPVIENQYRSQIAKFDERIAGLSKDLESAGKALDEVKVKGYKGEGTKGSPLTKDGKAFTGDYRGTQYKDGVKVTETKTGDKIEGSGTSDSPLKVNGKVVEGTYQGRKYVKGVVSTQAPKADAGDGKPDKTDKGKKGDKGKTTDAQIIKKAEELYGELDAIFESDAELQELLRTAVKNNYKTNRFVQELERTAWFKSNAGPVRQRQFYKNQYNDLVAELKKTDPEYQNKVAQLNQTSEYGRGLQSVIDSLREEETRQGKTLDENVRTEQAKRIYDLANEGNPLAYRNAVISFGKIGEATVGGEAATVLQGLRRVARANGFDFDTKYVGQRDTWLNSILAGENPERFYTLIRNDASQNQGAYVKELMKNGYNLDDVYNNYITLMAQAFNVDPNTIRTDDPLLQKAFNDKGGLKFNEFEALLRNDPRYKGTPGAAAEKDYRQSISDIAKAEGATLTDDQIDDIVNSALSLGAAANSSTVRNLIRAKIKYTPGSTVTGRAGDVLAELKATATANGINLDTAFGSSVQGWLQNVSQGESIETFKRLIRNTAKLGLPEKVGALMDQGVDLETIYSPYKNTMAAVLEINPQTINLSDPVLRSAINKDGEMNLYDYQRYLRRDPRWQFTANARDEMSRTALNLLRNFGFQG